MLPPKLALKMLQSPLTKCIHKGTKKYRPMSSKQYSLFLGQFFYDTRGETLNNLEQDSGRIYQE